MKNIQHRTDGEGSCETNTKKEKVIKMESRTLSTRDGRVFRRREKQRGETRQMKRRTEKKKVGKSRKNREAPEGAAGSEKNDGLRGGTKGARGRTSQDGGGLAVHTTGEEESVVNGDGRGAGRGGRRISKSGKRGLRGSQPSQGYTPRWLRMYRRRSGRCKGDRW